MSQHGFEIFKILLDKGLLAAIGILLGYWVSRKLEQFKHTQQARVRELEAARQDALRADEQRRQDQLLDEERRLVPRTEFDAQCEFYGPEPDGYPTMIKISVDNKGLTQRRFRSIQVRLLGIRGGTPLQFWPARGKQRLDFPERLVEDNLVDRPGDYYFVEPGVRQLFAYPTYVPADMKYVLLHIELKTIGSVRENEDEDTFTEERLFPVLVAAPHS